MSLTAGSYHTCGLTSSGEAYCWGGQASTGDVGFPSPAKITHARPTAVKGGLRFASLSTSSGNSTCGITAEGAAYCWDTALVPAAVPGGVSFRSIASADHIACGLDLDHVAHCWGDNNSLGQLANGSFAPPAGNAPMPITGALRFTQVATSSYGDSCGLADAGVAYCWGQNGWGQLGDGSKTNRSVPVAVSGGLSFSMVTVGWVHTCGLTSAGAAYCWGAGQLVDGSGAHILSPVPVSGGMAFRSISAGAGQTCGLTIDGAAYCWGSDPAALQGGGPTAVPGGLAFTSVTTGGNHACGLAVDGRAYCWGRNMYGQLGDGSGVDSNTPVLVSRQLLSPLFSGAISPLNEAAADDPVTIVSGASA